jgi:ketosteroid isomerase-like protein
MSQENVEVARRFIHAWNERDPETLAELTHPEGEILLPRNLLEGGSYVGPDGVRRALSDAQETWEEAHIEIEGTRDIGDQVAILARTVNVAKGGGPRTESKPAYLVSLRAGKLAHLLPFMSHAEALEAAGLRE